MRNIVLIGMRGSGKSTIGKMISKKLSMSFIDSDLEIENFLEMKIGEIVNKHGWEYFRIKEYDQISKITKQNQNAVISTGGGVVLNHQNIDLLKKNSIIVFINTPISTLQQRIKSNKRPSLTGGNVIDELEEIWKKRKDLYFEAADIVYNKNNVEISTLDAENIIKLIEKK